MSQGAEKHPPAKSGGANANTDAAAVAPVKPAAVAPVKPAAVAPAKPDPEEPRQLSYPEAVEQKDALSSALVAYLTSDQKKAFTATTRGGAWDANKNSTCQLAELYYRKLRSDRYDTLIDDLADELNLPGLELSKRANPPQGRKLVEPLATCARSIKEGDLWFCRSMNRHTAAFVQLHLTKKGLDPERTIMGQALMRQPGKHGGTGVFQLLTLAQLRELAAAALVNEGLKAFAPVRDEWVLHRSLMVPKTGIIGPYEKSYPMDLKHKIELSNDLFQMVRSESSKVRSACSFAQKLAWTSTPGGSLRVAEGFAAQLTGVSLGSSLVMFMGHAGPQLASLWNEESTCVESLADGEDSVVAGDFWFYEKPSVHTAAFIKVVRTDGRIDPQKTIMGHGFKRELTTAGGTGKFQLLTLSQLRQCMSARVKAYSPQSEWIVHRSLFPASV